MSASDDLERRFRRLLSLYPPHLRRAREEEMVTTLMDGAKPGQSWPTARETADLAGHGLIQRTLQPPRFAREHARALLIFRMLLAVWLVVVCVVLTTLSPWGLTVILAMVLNLFFAARVVLWMRTERDVTPG